MKIKHPLRYQDDLVPVQQVLRDLAAQENCDGEPYDQMMLAADYIDRLESQIKKLKIDKSCYRHGYNDLCEKVRTSAEEVFKNIRGERVEH